MNTTDAFLDPHTKRLRSGWRALIFLAVLMLPQWVMSFFLPPGPANSNAAIDVSAGAIITYAILAVWILFISWLCLKYLDGLSLRALGFMLHRAWWRDVLIGFGVSAAMIGLTVLLQAIGGGTRTRLNPAWWQAGSLNSAGLVLTGKDVLLALVFLVLAGAVEELGFRGYAFQTLLRGTSPIVPMLLLSIFFGYGHWENPSRTFFSTANTVLAGIWLSVAYLKTRSLWLPTALHFGWNWTMGAVFGLPVSGLQIPQHPILETTIDRPLWLTGGTYGPEGGAAATVVIAASTLLLWRAKWLSVAPDMRAALAETASPEDPAIHLNLQSE